MSFSKLGLSPVLQDTLKKIGYQKPTPIQEKAIPHILKGENIIAAAQTGSGKTASFVLPILHQLAQSQTKKKKRVRALIISPTRELALQIEKNIQIYAKGLELRSVALYGGVDEKPQKEVLIEGVDIAVATPGRLLDLYRQRAIYFEEIQTLVLDEADRMLDMGFIDEINQIIEKVPEQAQYLLFSATISKDIKNLARTAIDNPVEISLAQHQKIQQTISQYMIGVDKDKKSELLSRLILENNWHYALIFIRTRHGAAKLATQLEKRSIQAQAIHSGRAQAVRSQILKKFKDNQQGLLIATGVAARGIDIDNLPLVINYDLPDDADEYVHRIGRTGRAGAKGEAISLVSKDDFKRLCAIERRLGHLLERKEIEGFEPKKAVPISILNYVPKHKRN